MGTNLSVIVQEYHQLSPEEKAKALDELWEQDEEIRTYLESKAPPLPFTDLRLSQPLQLRKPPVKCSSLSRKRSLCIKEPVSPKDETTTAEIDLWNKNLVRFWSSDSHSFVPKDTGVEPVYFILTATVQFHSKNHGDCLRQRFIAVFWFDYFEETYPKRKSGFGSEYEDLARGVGLEVTRGPVEDVKLLRALVKAGRRYAALAKKFGEGILLTLPTSIGRTTLEEKLPLDQTEFDIWSEPIRDSRWHTQARLETVQSTGLNIRRFLLDKCGHQHACRRPAKRQKTNDSYAVRQEPSSSTAAASHEQTSPSAEPPLAQEEYSIGTTLHNATFAPPCTDQFRLQNSPQNVDVPATFMSERETIGTITETHPQVARESIDTLNTLPTQVTCPEEADASVATLPTQDITVTCDEDIEDAGLPGMLRNVAAYTPGGTQLHMETPGINLEGPMLSNTLLGSPRPMPFNLSAGPFNWELFEPEAFQLEEFLPEPFEYNSPSTIPSGTASSTA